MVQDGQESPQELNPHSCEEVEEVAFCLDFLLNCITLCLVYVFILVLNVHKVQLHGTVSSSMEIIQLSLSQNDII